MIRVTFADTASRDAFADRFKVNAKVDDTQLDIGWHFLQFAKLDPKALDYQQVAILQSGPGAAQHHEFVIKGDPTTFGPHATVISDMGNGFYHVSSLDGLALADHVDSIEHNQNAVTFLSNVSTMTDMNDAVIAVDPQSADAQWARIRIGSRYRPLNEQFVKHDTTYKSTPELIIMDSGLYAGHQEFQYDGLEIENFFTLPQFNGSYDDDIGHGTAVAAMACGKNLGIASHLKLVVMKIGGAGYNATLVDIGTAIDAILTRVSADPNKTRVVNMSWGIARSAWLDSKVQSLLDAGLTVVCAAGNQGISVEDISPAGLDTVITVGSIDKYDIPSGFNNISPGDSGLTTGHGLSLDIFAPGEDVTIPSKTPTAYSVGSGTSFSAPLIAGIATELAALHSTMVPYAQLKSLVLDTATDNALLFEDDRFSENQNKLGYLITVDTNTNYKENNMTLYLGVHKNNQPMVVDLNSSLYNVMPNIFPDDPPVWSIEFLDPEVGAQYSQFMNLNTTTGALTIDVPTVPLPPETKLKMIEFVVRSTTSRLSMESAPMFYFATNPDHQDTVESDITLALTETNSISFYASWTLMIK
jgi:hypothetical protein